MIHLNCQESQDWLIKLSLTSEGLLLEASLRLHAKTTSSGPTSWDIKITIPSHAGKCFAGGQKVLGVLRRRSRRAQRMKDLTAAPPKPTSQRCGDDHKLKVTEPMSTRGSISLAHKRWCSNVIV
jgi:hypothetical protein